MLHNKPKQASQAEEAKVEGAGARNILDSLEQQFPERVRSTAGAYTRPLYSST
jgi:hypothetical protein